MKLTRAFIFLVGLCEALTSTAQIPGSFNPAQIEPGRVGKELGAPPFQPTQTKAVGMVPQIKKQEVPKETENVKFKLTKVIITGNTVISDEALAKLYQSLLNKTISLADILKLVEQITAAYRNKGYVLSQAILPPQRIRNGVVTIKVVEGFIDKVTVTGKPGINRRLFRRYGELGIEERPLKVSNLERFMLLANDIPGAEVKAVITPSADITGAADLSLVSNQKYVSGYASYDNYGTEYLGPQEYTANLQLNSLFIPGSSDIIRYISSTQDKELRFIDFDHTQPVNFHGTVWAFGGSYTDTNPGFILKPFEIHGLSRIFYTGLNHPLVRSRTENLSIAGLFNYLDSYSSILGETQYKDRIRSLEVDVHYDITDRFKGINNFMFIIEQGLEGLGATNSGLLSRANGKVNFTKFNLNASRLQYLGGRCSFLIAGLSQYSFEPLLAAEEFGFGGPDFGRGYDPSEITGDQGVAAKAEFRVDTHPVKILIQTLQFYTFYDIGKVWNIQDPFDLQISHISASSTGLGARFYFKKYLFANVYAAKPLTLPKATLVLSGENGNRIEYYFQITLLLN